MNKIRRIVKNAKLLHSKLFIGLACLATLGCCYIGGKTYQYHHCDLNRVFYYRSFTSPSFNHNVVSSMLSDNIGEWNTSDMASNPTYANSDTSDYDKSIWFNHGLVGLDNSSVWESDMYEDILNNWSDKSDIASKYSFSHNNNLDPSDKMSVKHSSDLAMGNFTKAVNRYSSDSLQVARNEKTISYSVNNRKHNISLTIHQTPHDVYKQHDSSNIAHTVIYHLYSIHGLLPMKYRFRPIKVKAYNHKWYKASHFRNNIGTAFHNFTLSKSAQIKE